MDGKKLNQEYLLTVIIPVYNSEKYLARCLDSILHQSLKHIEIICVDDGSLDGSGNILNEYQSIYSNVVVFHQVNSGPSAARNLGMKNAHGKYIAFVDSDDSIEQDMYDTMIGIAEKYSLNVVMCNYMNDYSGKSSKIAEFDLPVGNILNKGEIRQFICPYLMQDSQYNGPCNKVYLRSFVTSLNICMPENLKYGEDLIFQMEIYDKLEELYYCNIPFYHYIHRENSLSGIKTNMLHSTLIPMYHIRLHYAKLWNIPERDVAEYFCYYAIMDLVNSMGEVSLIQKGKLFLSYCQNDIVCNAMQNCTLTRGQFTKKICFMFWLCKTVSDLLFTLGRGCKR